MLPLETRSRFSPTASLQPRLPDAREPTDPSYPALHFIPHPSPGPSRSEPPSFEPPPRRDKLLQQFLFSFDRDARALSPATVSADTGTTITPPWRVRQRFKMPISPGEILFYGKSVYATEINKILTDYDLFSVICYHKCTQMRISSVSRTVFHNYKIVTMDSNGNQASGNFP